MIRPLTVHAISQPRFPIRKKLREVLSAKPNASFTAAELQVLVYGHASITDSQRTCFSRALAVVRKELGWKRRFSHFGAFARYIGPGKVAAEKASASALMQSQGLKVSGP